MKNLLNLSSFLFCIIIVAIACSKSGNNYSTTDHTVGVIQSRSWTGTANGYLQGDTIEFPPPDVTHVPWAYAFNRVIADTSFPVTRINGFEISALGTMLTYKATDSTLQTVKFDSTLSGAAKSVFTFYYAKDSITYEYHSVSGYNATQNQYYQVNELWHTKPK